LEKEVLLIFDRKIHLSKRMMDFYAYEFTQGYETYWECTPTHVSVLYSCNSRHRTNEQQDRGIFLSFCWRMNQRTQRIIGTQIVFFCSHLDLLKEPNLAHYFFYLP
jgi:hypothetical protein